MGHRDNDRDKNKKHHYRDSSLVYRLGAFPVALSPSDSRQLPPTQEVSSVIPDLSFSSIYELPKALSIAASQMGVRLLQLLFRFFCS